MPIKIPQFLQSLPAVNILINENIFIMDEEEAVTQDIRPLEIVILNLMPTKIVTETQFLRVLSNTPLQVNVTFLATASYTSKNTPQSHLLTFYKTFKDIKAQKFDGLIITGAPVETLEFEQVDYWEELCQIMKWAKTNVFSTLFVCWGAYAGLNYHYGIEKIPLKEKMFGIFEHKTLFPSHPLLRGFDEVFYAPHSRYTGLKQEEVAANKNLIILSASEQAGIYIVASKNGREVYVTGHGEYDFDTLAREYYRDKERGLNPKIPYNYFFDDNPKLTPANKWRAHGHMLYSNWLNYFVYQETPYNIEEIL